MTCGVYEIWCGPYFYQGSSKNIERRVKTHLRALKNGKHENCKFQAVYNKHGWGSFAVLIECEEHALAVWEQQYLDANFGNENFINLNPEAYRPPHTPETWAKISAAKTGVPRSEETKAKLSEVQRGVPKPPRSPEHQAKLNATKVGVPRSEETKAKLSAAATGKTLSAEHRAKIGAAQKGRPGVSPSDEVRAKISAAKTGKPGTPLTPEQRQARSLAMKAWHERRKAAQEASA